MRGHQSIIELRRMGKKPVQVWVFLLEAGCHEPRFINPEELLENGSPPEVYIDHDEEITGLDMRFLNGVLVHLQGQNLDRLRAAFQQIRRCKPQRIIASGAAFFDTGATEQ